MKAWWRLCFFKKFLGGRFPFSSRCFTRHIHNAQWKPVQLHNQTDINLCKLLQRKNDINRYKMRRLRQFIHNHRNSIKASYRLRKSSHKIHRHTIPLHYGICNDYNKSKGLWCSTFYFWQVKQTYKKRATSVFMPDQQNNFLRYRYIFVAPEWII